MGRHRRPGRVGLIASVATALAVLTVGATVHFPWVATSSVSAPTMPETTSAAATDDPVATTVPSTTAAAPTAALDVAICVAAGANGGMFDLAVPRGEVDRVVPCQTGLTHTATVNALFASDPTMDVRCYVADTAGGITVFSGTDPADLTAARSFCTNSGGVADGS